MSDKSGDIAAQRMVANSIKTSGRVPWVWLAFLAPLIIALVAISRPSGAHRVSCGQYDANSGDLPYLVRIFGVYFGPGYKEARRQASSWAPTTEPFDADEGDKNWCLGALLDANVVVTTRNCLKKYGHASGHNAMFAYIGGNNSTYPPIMINQRRKRYFESEVVALALHAWITFELDTGERGPNRTPNRKPIGAGVNRICYEHRMEVSDDTSDIYAISEPAIGAMTRLSLRECPPSVPIEERDVIFCSANSGSSSRGSRLMEGSLLIRSVANKHYLLGLYSKASQPPDGGTLVFNQLVNQFIEQED